MPWKTCAGAWVISKKSFSPKHYVRGEDSGFAKDTALPCKDTKICFKVAQNCTVRRGVLALHAAGMCQRSTHAEAMDQLLAKLRERGCLLHDEVEALGNAP